MNPKNYQFIDLKYLYDMADGNKDFLEEMLTDYLDKTPVYFKELQDSYEQKDLEAAYMFSHKLKSSYQFTGSNQLVQLAGDIELNCKQGINMEQVGDMLNTLKTVSMHVDEELRKELKLISASL